ncbi:MAG TPA: CDP-diacylglycerol--serine O-phosphatidyltransferase [Terriglobia bacterium]|nr:CDP-diacylglycerol--serine O-phosphatidyltransferase [Terriglobia bacterium]
MEPAASKHLNNNEGTETVANNHRLRRGMYVLPSLFTVGTLICGYYATLTTVQAAQLLAGGAASTLAANSFDSAAIAIGLAILFDGLDGRIARLTNATSNFGREFDSLADVIAFGLAPGLLAYSWGVRPAIDASVAPWTHHLRPVGWIITFAYLICGAARLARFNIESAKPGVDRRYFVGLPIPAAAGVIAAVVHWAKDPLTDWPLALLWLLATLALAFLMVSRVRYSSFKALDLRRRRPYVTIIFIGLIIWAIIFYSEPVLLVMALTYALSGLVHLFPGKARPSPPAHEEAKAQ